jgi:hypothetical protein
MQARPVSQKKQQSGRQSATQTDTHYRTCTRFKYRTGGRVSARGTSRKRFGTSEGSLLEQGLVLALLRGVKGVQPQVASLGFTPKSGISGNGARLERGFGERNGS